MSSSMGALMNTVTSMVSVFLTAIIIIIALGVMLQVVTPGAGLKQIASLIGLVIVATLLARSLYALLSSMSFLSYAACAVIGILVWRWKRNSTKGENR